MTTTADSPIATPDATASGQQHRIVSGTPRSGAIGRVTVGRIVSAELIKLRTTRSMVYAMLVTVLSIVGVGVMAASGLIVAGPPVDGTAGAATVDPAGGSLTGVSLAVYVVATLSVLAVTSEYTTGTIKSTLAAVPRRTQLVIGKAIAVAAVTLTITLFSTVTAFFAAKAVLSTADISITLTAPGVLRAVVGAALYLTVVALLSAGLGWLLRSTAGALASLVGILAVLPVVGLLLPRSIGDTVMPYLPDNAGTAIMQLTPGGQLGPWTGLAVFIGYALIALSGAALLIRHRDA